MLTKTDSYYCDREAVRTEQTGNTHSRGKELNAETYYQERGMYKGFRHTMPAELPNGRNLRDVWVFPSQPSGFKHYAAFPEKLPDICIRAATPEVGVCAVCGTPWSRIIKTKPMVMRRTNHAEETGIRIMSSGTMLEPEEVETIGWKPSCKCKTDLPPVPATVLDPFNGTGRTMWVAKKLGRRSIGYELSVPYCEMSVNRNRQGGLL
jgi:hypothetical protein